METTNCELPGAVIHFSSVGSTGSSQNGFGVGDIDISIHRPGEKFPWIDLGRINYSSPTQTQYEDAETSPDMSEGRKAYVDINRRISKKQANYITFLICEMLKSELNGEIPADYEIDDLLKQRLKR